jgi:hypothetical protein
VGELVLPAGGLLPAWPCGWGSAGATDPTENDDGAVWVLLQRKKKRRLQGFGLARRGEREEKLSELLMTASGGSKDVGASFCRFGEPESFPFGDALNVTARASYADTRFPVFLRP